MHQEDFLLTTVAIAVPYTVRLWIHVVALMELPVGLGGPNAANGYAYMNPKVTPNTTLQKEVTSKLNRSKVLEEPQKG